MIQTGEEDNISKHLGRNVSIQELIQSGHTYQFAIIFGYGPVLPGKQPTSGRLNVFGRLNGLAAGMLSRFGWIDKFIFTGGKTGGPQRPSEAALMACVAQEKFTMSPTYAILEQESYNTIQNLVYVANIIDSHSPYKTQILFVGMGYHLSQIKEIANLVILEGDFLSTEDVVRLRSAHHRCYLDVLLHPENPGSIREKIHQERMLYGLREMPDFWLPEIAHIENTSRLKAILKVKRIQPFLRQHDIESQSASPEQLRKWLASIPKRTP